MTFILVECLAQCPADSDQVSETTFPNTRWVAGTQNPVYTEHCSYWVFKGHITCKVNSKHFHS